MLTKLSNYFLVLAVGFLFLLSPLILKAQTGCKIEYVPYYELEQVTVYDYDARTQTSYPRTEWQNVKKWKFQCVPTTGETNSSDAKVPKAEIQKVWVDHSVLEDKKNGMRIHSAFDVSNLKDKKCSANIYFFFAVPSNGVASFNSALDAMAAESQGKQKTSNMQLDAIAGKPLKDFNDKFNTSDGYVTVNASFTPKYESSTYKDFQLFMPYDELHLDKGEFNLKFIIGIQCEGLGFLTKSEDYEFSYSRSK